MATEERIVNDLNRALALTIAEKRHCWLTTDTIKAYRQLQGAMSGNIVLDTKDDMLCRHLTIPQLRGMTRIRFDVLTDGESHGMSGSRSGLCSDTVVWREKRLGASVALRSYAQCSAAAVFGMSDQRLPLCLCVTAMLWGTAAVARRRRGNMMRPALVTCTVLPEEASGNAADSLDGPYYGGMALSADGNSFLNSTGQTVRLTPMQHRLMRMFFESSSHCLPKEEICEALWPRKEDASDTLYALVRRLKTVLETCSDLRIVAERGRAYRLTVRQTE